MFRIAAVALAVAFVAESPGAIRGSAPLTVNTTDDADDSTCACTHCSLREAIAAANANGGPDTVAFANPSNDALESTGLNAGSRE